MTTEKIDIDLGFEEWEIQKGKMRKCRLKCCFNTISFQGDYKNINIYSIGVKRKETKEQ